MNVKELIASLQKLEQEGHGELEVFLRTDGEGTYLSSEAYLVDNEEDDYPDDWNMPPYFIEILG